MNSFNLRQRWRRFLNSWLSAATRFDLRIPSDKWSWIHICCFILSLIGLILILCL